MAHTLFSSSVEHPLLIILLITLLTTLLTISLTTSIQLPPSNHHFRSPPMPPDRHRPGARPDQVQAVTRRWPDITSPACTLTPLPRGTAHNGNVIQLGSVVAVNVRGGSQPALVNRLFAVSGATTKYAHVQWLSSSPGGQFLRAYQPGSPACTNIKISSILRVLDVRVCYVQDPLGVAWRDPRPPGPHNPSGKADPFSPTSCDSCLSAEAERHDAPKIVYSLDEHDSFTSGGEEYHVGDLVFFEPPHIKMGDAWTPGILTKPHRRDQMEWGLRVCGRYSDLRGAGERFVDPVSQLESSGFRESANLL